MAGKILLQRWLDWKTGVLPANEEFLFSELNLRTLEISLGPFLLNFTCEHSVPPALHEMPRPRDISSFSSPNNWQDAFWAFACTFLIHPFTGLISQVTEGDLIQLPYNQSSVEWRLPGGVRKVWTTELAGNVRDARIAVIQRALEEFLRLADSSGAAWLIVSGIEGELFQLEAFFRALSVFADHTAKWTAATIDQDTLKEKATPLIGYLEDLHVLELVRVYRHLELSVAGCEVLKFTFREKPVSIIAGPAGPDVWIQGFKDVWLEMTADEDLPPSADLFPKVRYRCPEASPALLSQVKQDLCRQLALNFDLALLSGHGIKMMKPLVFASASVSCKRDIGDVNNCLERLETAGQFVGEK